MISRFKIVAGVSATDSSIELNGVPLEGVRRISLDIDAAKRGERTLLKLEVYGEAIIEGEYVERLIAASQSEAEAQGVGAGQNS